MAGALTAAIASIFSGSAVTPDPYFEYTTLLLPGSGTNGAQNNTFLDGSTNNFTITRNGNTTQGTFSPFSQTGWGNYFDGSSYIGNTSTTSVVAAGTSNFTAEFWVYATTDQQSQAYGTVFHVGGATSGAWFIGLLYSSAGAMKIRIGTYAADYDSTSTIAPNRWYHIALVREGTGSNQTKVYVDGSLFHTFTLSDNFSNSSAIYVGTTGFNLAARRLSGYVSNLRFTVGTALYTTAFTPATSPLTTTSQGATASQVEVLTCQSNRFLDNSSNGWTFTTSGSPTVVAFSPFNPTASWSAATYGGSGYFDGSADFLTGPTTNAAFDFGADPFTIEFWIYPTSFGATQTVVASLDNATAGALAFGVQITTSGAVQTYVWNGSSYFINVASNTGVVKLNAWNYVAVVRSGANFGCFVNGNREGSSTTISGTQAANKTLNVGRDPYGAGSLYVFGYLSNIRIVKGTAVYDPTQTTNTVPTAPLTAITNTSLLLNFTNAGIYDVTSKNDLETVADAQISNTTAKWGSTSIKFDGTGDYLTAQNNPLLNLGSSNFTIEAWIYPTTLNTYNYLYGRDGATNATSEIDFYIGSTGNIASYFYSGSTGYLVNSSGGAITTNSWQHVALVRNGVNYTIYVNGTSVATIATLSTLAANTVSLLPTIGNSSTTLTRPFTGYIQDFRFTRGYARYTANFTPPTAAFPTL